MRGDHLASRSQDEERFSGLLFGLCVPGDGWAVGVCCI